MGIEEGEMSFIYYFNTSKIYYEGFLWGLILKSRKDPCLLVMLIYLNYYGSFYTRFKSALFDFSVLFFLGQCFLRMLSVAGVIVSKVRRCYYRRGKR